MCPVFGKYKIHFSNAEKHFLKSLKAKQTISAGKPAKKKKGSQNTFMIIYWKTFEHCTGGKSTSILCRPSGSHHRHPQQRNSAQTFPPITQQPPPSVTSFRSPFCLVFLVLRVHFSESILKSPLGSCRSTDLA